MPDKVRGLKKKKLKGEGNRTNANPHREAKVMGSGGNTAKAEASNEKWPGSSREGESLVEQMQEERRGMRKLRHRCLNKDGLHEA